LKSAYGGQEGQGVTAAAQAPADSRVLVVSSSQFLANPLARAGNAPPMPPQMMMMGGMGGDGELQQLSQGYAQEYLTNTILAFQNTMAWAAGDSTLLATSAKLPGDASLSYSDIRKPSATATEDQDAIQRQFEDYKNERKNVQNRIKLTLIIVPALLFALLGV